MTDLNIKVMGIEEAVGKLHTWELAKMEEVKNLVNSTGLKVESGAKTRCPVDTGRLRSSIHMELFNGGLTVEVGTDVNYAPFVEFGSGSRVSIPAGLEEYAAQFKGRKPANPGQKAQPYLYPAWEEQRSEYLAKLKEILGR